MKKINYLVIAIVGILLLACSNSKETGFTKKITRIEVEGVEYDNSFKYYYTLSYDEQGRIVKITPEQPELFGTYYCEYENNKFRMGKDEEVFISGTLNKHGHVQASNSPYYMDEMLVGYMKYNSKRQLISIFHSEEGKMSFIWKDGDLVQLEIMGDQIDFTYTSLENKNKFGLKFMIDTDNCTPVFLYDMLLGTPSKHLPESLGKGEERIDYRYEMDKDGYIGKMTMIYPENSRTAQYRFVYE